MNIQDKLVEGLSELLDFSLKNGFRKKEDFCLLTKEKQDKLVKIYDKMICQTEEAIEEIAEEFNKHSDKYVLLYFYSILDKHDDMINQLDEMINLNEVQ